MKLPETVLGGLQGFFLRRQGVGKTAILDPHISRAPGHRKGIYRVHDPLGPRDSNRSHKPTKEYRPAEASFESGKGDGSHGVKDLKRGRGVGSCWIARV